MTNDSDRHARGLKLMEAVQGGEAAQRIRESFADVCPDFADYIVEAGFGDVYGREGLTLAQRQLLNVAVLTAIGGAERQLAIHIRGALNIGVSPREIVEAIFHVALYAGHPRAVNGFRIAQETFEQQDVTVEASS